MKWLYSGLFGATAIMAQDLEHMTFYKIGIDHIKDDGTCVCKPGYTLVKEGKKKKMARNYDKKARGTAKSQTDALLQKVVHDGIMLSKCLKNEKITELDIDYEAVKRGAVDWNCHDDQCDIPVTLKGIWGYGCWCNFGGDLMKGKGTPVNPHDKVCQDMQLCLRCAEMDASSDGYACNVKTVTYNSLLQLGAVGLADNDNSINSGCTSINGNDKCAAHTCACEVQMINDILELVWQGYAHDMAPRHPDNPYGGAFDWDSQCFTDPNGQIIKECCGKYPFRFPYNSLNKECCEKGGEYATYNPLDQVCCDSGVEKVSNGGCN